MYKFGVYDMSSSESELDFNEINIWNPRKISGKPEKQSAENVQLPSHSLRSDDTNKFEKTSVNLQHKRLDHLKGQIQKQKEVDLRLEQRREWRKNRRLMRKLHCDPAIQKAIKDETGGNEEVERCETQVDQSESWKEIKSYLSVNDHLAGPVSHGKCGPKTELESVIDDCIDKGDFDKAELLSDHLSNREFGSKIAHAFAAKRCAENKAKEDAIQKAKKLKKLNWGFEPKERWEMKGNM